MTASDQGLQHAGHFVQFYKADEPVLNRNVGRFLWEGLLRGDGLLVFATARRREDVTAHLRRLGAEVEQAVSEGQLLLRDAQETLDQVMVGGVPVWQRFEQVVTQALDLVSTRATAAGVRAYGELVGVLWEAGKMDAAIQLEQYWNRLLESRRITLFCGYPIDVFAADIESHQVKAVLNAHTHMIAAGRNGDMEDAIQRAAEEVLGAQPNVGTEEGNGKNRRRRLPAAEQMILWLREHVPEAAAGILDRARQYYETTQTCSD